MANPIAVHAELSRLRRDIARLEGRFADADRLAEAAGPGPQLRVPGGRKRSGTLPLGVPRLDAALGGGLRLATLHEIRAAETRDGAAAAGFALSVIARLGGEAGAAPPAAPPQPAKGRAAAAPLPRVLWISDAESRREAGDLYGPGLAALGLEPGSLVRVAVRTEAEALWAFEAALTCRGLLVAVCELRRPALDLTETRRCALRAREAGVTGLLLRLGAEPEPTVAETRFRLAAAQAGTIEGFGAGVGRMAWRLSLEKSRSGRTGRWTVEWDAHDRCFTEAGRRTERALPQPVAAAPAHRSADAAREGGWRQAS